MECIKSRKKPVWTIIVYTKSPVKYKKMLSAFKETYFICKEFFNQTVTVYNKCMQFNK